MTFPGTDSWYLDNVLGLIRNEKHEPIARLTNLDAGERIVACVNALAGLNPAKLAELIAACDDLALLLDGKPSLFHQSLSNTLRAALAKLRGTGGGE